MVPEEPAELPSSHQSHPKSHHCDHAISYIISNFDRAEGGNLTVLVVISLLFPIAISPFPR